METKLALALLLAALATPALADETSAHHEMVVSHGASVMPFDQKIAMHMFNSSGSGGTLEVMVHDMDTKQIALVRAHLRREAELFATGDYSDPAYIHGAAMPGLRGMESNLVAVRYSATPMGAKIVFVSTDPAAIDAIHHWLAAQARDHRATGKHCDMKM